MEVKETPTVVEKTMPDTAAEDLAAKEFSMGMPAFKKMVKNKRALSRNDLARILIKLIEYPLEDSERQLRGLSDDIFKLGSLLLNCKLIMMQKVFNDKLIKGEENVEESKVVESGNSPQE